MNTDVALFGLPHEKRMLLQAHEPGNMKETFNLENKLNIGSP